MNYSEFVEWSYWYCPEGVDMDDFHQYLACANASMINSLSEKFNIPIPDLLDSLTPDYNYH